MPGIEGHASVFRASAMLRSATVQWMSLEPKKEVFRMLHTLWSLALVVALLSSSVACRKTVQIATPALPRVIEDKKVRYDAKAYQNDKDRYEKETNTDRLKLLRNRIAYSVMTEIDAAYGEYTAKLLEGRGATAVLADTLQLGLTAAATIAAPVRTKTILSAIATGLGGVNLSFDKNFFAQQTIQTIAIGMDKRRERSRTQITGHLTTDSNEAYPLEAARRDLIEYFNAGTLVGGLQELQEDTAKTDTTKTASTKTATTGTTTTGTATAQPEAKKVEQAED